MAEDHKPIVFAGAHDMPDSVMSISTMLWNKTGSWRYLKPQYQNHTPPCNQGCPVGNDIEGFIRLIAEGKPGDAWRLLKEENPMPAVTGRVCFHPCENACNRKDFDESTAIQNLERFAADNKGEAELMKVLRPESGKKIAVVGAGPAGLAAAYHARRLGHAVTVFDALPKAGGLLRVGIPAYRLPRAVLDAEIASIERLGVQFKLGVRIGKDVPFEKLREFDAVFLATGVHLNRKLGIEGEDAAGVVPGLQVLTKNALGEKFDCGKRAVVIGGGNSAVDAARVLRRMGCDVTVYYRRTRFEMPAFEDEVNDAEEEGVKLELLAAPTRVIVEEGHVAGVEMQKMMLGEPDESGRRRPEPVAGSAFIVPCDMAVSAIGEKGDLTYLPEDVKQEWGKIVIDDFNLAGVPGVFAGGDIASAQQNVAQALGDGKTAAIAIDRFLGGESMDALQNIIIGESGRVSMAAYVGGEAHAKIIGQKKVVAFADMNAWHFNKVERIPPTRLPINKRLAGFDEVEHGLTGVEALEAAERCLHCGVCTMCDNCYVFCPDVSILHRTDGEYGYEINFDYCKGCGICVHECPRHAMVLVEG
jgi:NADPH-dependent glutamate synthase beta subunit-like oxidoreductase/Pyruvate/2-oxoacid:ferredoxin oxidoreductase delta subunit